MLQGIITDTLLEVRFRTFASSRSHGQVCLALKKHLLFVGNNERSHDSLYGMLKEPTKERGLGLLGALGPTHVRRAS